MHKLIISKSEVQAYFFYYPNRTELSPSILIRDAAFLPLTIGIFLPGFVELRRFGAAGDGQTERGQDPKQPYPRHGPEPLPSLPKLHPARIR